MTKGKNIKDGLTVTVDLKTYPLEAIYGASYVFIDRVYIFLESLVNNKVKVSFKAKEGMTGRHLAALAGEFANELLNYAFRLNLAKENKKLRQYIIEQALFAATTASQPTDDFAASGLGYSEEDDPLGIAIPWEEKYGQAAAAPETKAKTITKKTSSGSRKVKKSKRKI